MKISKHDILKIGKSDQSVALSSLYFVYIYVCVHVSI